jgi:tRNA threonylcarbamoyladenosine biosynthesis protein TsaB
LITLSIDTSTARGSVAVLVDHELVFDQSFLADRDHSAHLFPVLERARNSVTRIDQIGVGLGPGSYAGVRIAIAAAIGLRLGWDATLVGIPSVAALDTTAREYLAIGDARRETFYFSHLVEGVAIQGPLLVNEAELRARLTAQEGLPIYVCAPLEGFPQAQQLFPSASRIARLVAARRGIIAEGDLEPIYLREPYITQPRK